MKTVNGIKWNKENRDGREVWISEDGAMQIAWGFAGLYNGWYEQDRSIKAGGRRDHGYIVLYLEDGKSTGNHSFGYSSITRAMKAASGEHVPTSDR